MKKGKLIILVHPMLGKRQFPKQQALNIMAIENNGGWEYLKKDEPELIESKPKKVVNAPSVGNKGTSKESKSKDGNSKGNKPTE